ncbi:hypothetical protein OS493_029197 [Desmophyllum pertusum]|uniref:Uncharacterized protein n=1 Tax=Desmophyllum pertusum TaxID=174260 RepID=A0A9X0D7L9_9CNID|nr:hypothetical protein OS493_029197 [Desmophyllum pertusum]
MDSRPGKQHRCNSKLTDQYLAGRGRALKEFSRRSPKAEEVKRRKQLQHLIMSGQIMLDKETIDKYFSPGKNGSTCGSASSSSSQLQLEESDSCTDLTSEKYCSKAPVGNSKDCDSDHDSNIPPRFRNNQFGKHFKKNKPWLNRPMQNSNEGQFEDASSRQGKRDQPRKQEQPVAATVASNGQNQQTSSDPWNDWEASVVVQAPVIDDEDLEELVVVDDNDTIDDVMVQQYVNALHQEQQNGAAVQLSKITPSRIQELGNLKSTINADSIKVPPGTVPNPPKGSDRWGGSELKGIDRPTGWGDIVEDSSNWYDDGSTLWSNPAMPYGASGGWSWNS